MWHDIETTEDFLNFGVVAQTAANFIKESGENPISVGVSGNWGVGKTSLVKMIRLEIENSGDKSYCFIDFNAWLYQGYDDARMALLQTVADFLLEKTKENQSLFQKAKAFCHRVNLLRFFKIFPNFFDAHFHFPSGIRKASLSPFLIRRLTVNSIVTKLASPPTKLDIGSAMNTPLTPSAAIRGSRIVSGTTMIILRKREKNTACRDWPRPTNADCPENWNAIMKKPKKYICMNGTPASISAGSELNILIIGAGKRKSISQASSIYTTPVSEENAIPRLTRPYSRAPKL